MSTICCCDRSICTTLRVLFFVAVFALPLEAEEQRPAVADGPSDKPHMRAAVSGTSIGGYIDHELFWNDEKRLAINIVSSPLFMAKSTIAFT